MLTVIIPTSMRRDNPSTAHIERAIDSLATIKYRKIIVCDGFNERAGNAHKYRTDSYGKMSLSDYNEYKRALHKLDAEVIEIDRHVNLTGVVSRGIDESQTEAVFIFQHDFFMLKLLDIESILAELSNPNTPVKHLRLNKRANMVAGYDWAIVDDKNISIPAIKTTAWSDNPHFTTKQYYNQLIRPAIANIGTYPEAIIMPQYSRVIQERGFNYAHGLYGTYIYGGVGESAYVGHTE